MRTLFLFLLFFGFGRLWAQTDTLYILQTTDVHGHVRPYDYFQDKAADYGLARIFTRVIDYRLKHKNVVLVDGGDLLQGTPLIYYFNRIETSVPNPMILTLNFMGYSAMAVGNHDIEQGLFTYLRARDESHFPWLSANSVLPDGRTFFKPYTIIEHNGIKIGIIGLTTPGIPMWLEPSLYPGITWKDMVQTARKYVPLVRPQVDVLVGLFHAGLDSGYSAKQTAALGLPNENASALVARKVTGFDVIFAGHSHRPYPKKGRIVLTHTERTLLINAGSWARNLGVAEIILRKKEQSTRRPWQVIAKEGWLEPMKKVIPSPAIMDLTKYYHKKTLAYIRQPIATLTDTLSARNARFQDNPVVELINRAQMAYTKADISFAASFNDHFKIPPGKIRIKDVYGMYRYENFLYVVEMTGQQIRDYLQYCARYYLKKGDKIIANPKMAGYNYDMAEGIKYKITVTREDDTGENTVGPIIYLKTGRPLDMHRRYKVALNSYRAMGGGGHMAAAHVSEKQILFKSDEEMRNILADYIQQQKIIHPVCDGNWTVVRGE